MKKISLTICPIFFHLFFVFITTSYSSSPSLVYDINSGSNSAAPFEKIVFNSKLYFSANDGIHGEELWAYDGTNPPTMVADIVPGEGRSAPQNLTVFNSKLFFNATDTIHGEGLWGYDGMNPPTRVADMYYPDKYSCSDAAICPFPGYFTELNSKLYFRNEDEVHGMELWVYDGTNPPTIAANINTIVGPSSEEGSNPEYLTVFNSKLYFGADDGVYGSELFVYDGTNPPTIAANINTVPSPSISNDEGSNPEYLTVFNSKLYFSADDGVYGSELWVYDGTNPPTMVANINTSGVPCSSCDNDQGSYPQYLTVFNSKLYFTANDGIHGREIWIYDGKNSPAMLADINPYSDPYEQELLNPAYLTIFNSKLYFRAYDGIHGSELWGYDGKTPPTMVADIVPGGSGSYPADLAVFNSKLYFTANDSIHGYEMWFYDGKLFHWPMFMPAMTGNAKQ